VQTSAGEVSARVLVSAAGALADPAYPDIPGLDSFAGTVMHSARWDAGHDLTGEQVAVIGTGASAIQIVPNIQPVAKRVLVFQRTPPWVLPHAGREVGPRLRALYRRFPALQRLSRGGVYALRELLVVGMALEPRVLKIAELISRAQMRMQLPDPDMRRKVTPDYRFGCKRLLPSDDWYPALAQPNVELVPHGVAEVRGRSLVAADGSEHEVDVVVFATGFSPTDPPFARIVRGPSGDTLSQSWGGSPQAHLGTTVSGFPNLFLLWGPNLNTGHTSVVYMLESQLEYVVGALRAARDRGLAALDVRREAQDAWNASVQERLAGSVWDTGGCSSWYIDANGRNSIMWPDFTFNFRRRVREFDLGEYHVEALPAASVSAAA